MTDFTSIPDVPSELPESMRRILESLKENMELLIAQRGLRSNVAIVHGDITTDYPPDITHDGEYYVLGTGESVPTIGDHVRVANEVTALQTQFNTLLSELK